MKKVITRLLILCSQRYIRRSGGVVIAVVGSVGKTSTTQAIAHVLSAKYAVIRTRKNYNVLQTVPLSIFQMDFATSPLSWLVVILRVLLKSYILPVKKVDFYVLELGTDQPGEIELFDWLNPEIAVLSAISHEHMENFGGLDDVAAEELRVAAYSKELLVNGDMPDVLKYVGNTVHTTYSNSNHILKKCSPKLMGEHSMTILSAAIEIGQRYYVPVELIIAAIDSFEPVAGRMQRLQGRDNITIIDDTYNSSPAATEQALKCLYTTNGTKKIALLGQMNEMGKHSEVLHKQIAEYLQPGKIDLLVTLFGDMNKYTATEAEKKGIKVIRTDNFVQAAKVLDQNVIPGCVVLAKGSQNGVFAEEAIKPLLANTKDIQKLVRQTPYWQKIKSAII
jgi:UDP-N-acetylmuramoyl-tripeptide--D-alanyl-D-alanine ligase